MASQVHSRGATTMPESPVNPYESPSAAEETRSRRPTTPSATGFRVLLVLNASALVGILVTQGLFAARLEALEAELPPLTTLALGPVLPSIHVILLLTIIAVRRALKAERYNDFWESILLVLLGVIVGNYIIAVWLAYPFRPPPLT